MKKRNCRPASPDDLQRLARQYEQRQERQRPPPDHADKVLEFGARYKRLK